MLRSRSLRNAVLFFALNLLTFNPASHAVGWGPNDFIIGGGTNLGGRIGVFDPNLSFKGYLENPSSLGIEDFDAAGRLVGKEGSYEVRLYDPSGNYAGGFFRSDEALRGGVGLRMAQNGDYILPERPDYGFGGVLEFTPDGKLVSQYGSGLRALSLVVVPGNRAWISLQSEGANALRVIDLASFEQVGTISLPNVGPQSMRFSPSSNTVLMASVLAHGVVETDLNGQIVRRFDLPSDVFSIGDVTRGPNGDVLASADDSTQKLIRWHGDGTLVGTYSVSQPIGDPSAIIWAGDVPEPEAGAMVIAAMSMFSVMRPARAARTPERCPECGTAAGTAAGTPAAAGEARRA